MPTIRSAAVIVFLFLTDTHLASDRSPRQTGRHSGRAEDPAIGKQRRFRNAIGRRYPIKVGDGSTDSGAEYNPRRPEGR